MVSISLDDSRLKIVWVTPYNVEIKLGIRTSLHWRFHRTRSFAFPVGWFSGAKYRRLAKVHCTLQGTQSTGATLK